MQKIIITSRDDEYVHFMVFEDTGAWIGENVLAVKPIIEKVRQSGRPIEEVILEANETSRIRPPDYSNLYKFFEKAGHTHPPHDHPHGHKALEDADHKNHEFIKSVKEDLREETAKRESFEDKVRLFREGVNDNFGKIDTAVIGLSNRLHELKDKFDQHGPHNDVSKDDLKAEAESVHHRFRATEDRLRKIEDEIESLRAQIASADVTKAIEAILVRLSKHDTAIQSIGNAERWQQVGSDQEVGGKKRRIMERLL